MKFVTKVLPICLLLGAVTAPAQYSRLKGATVAVSGTGLFSTSLTSNESPVTTNVASGTGGFLSQTVSGQKQGSNSQPGILATVGFHPVPWAGLELNYQFAQFTEEYSFYYSSQPTVRTGLRVPLAFHEATAAYQFHPKHIKFQPYINVGGGAIDFYPQFASNQWRGTGLVETGFDIPTRSPHLAIRIQGRALVYRKPNFNNSAISTRGWRVTEQPTAGLVYRF